MFYPELSKISKDGTSILSEELIESIDVWLATLPSAIKDKITVSRFSAKFGLDYSLSRSILEKLYELKIFERVYAILCPECEHVLRVSNEQTLLEDMNEISFCYACDENVSIEAKNIEVRYKLIKEPNDPEKMNKLRSCVSNRKSFDPEDAINALIKENKLNTNNLFYNPTEEQYILLENLFYGVTKKSGTNMEKGNSLEELALAIMNTIKTLEATSARTQTNQIDCYVIKKFNMPGTIFEKIGDVIYCECKNEKSKPDNNYYHKLNDIIVLSRADPKDYRLGILFSRLKCTKTCETIAQKSYDRQNVYLVNFYLEELKEIIFKKVNFLDFLRMKMDILEHALIQDKNLKTAYLY